MNAKKVALVIAAIGLLISIYLVILRYTSILPLDCPDKGIINCSNVLNSKYSTILGVPNAVLGLVFFIAELIVIEKYFGKDEMLLLSSIGMVFVAYFVLSEYIIGNICLFCTGVHASTLALFLMSIKYKEKEKATS